MIDQSKNEMKNRPDGGIVKKTKKDNFLCEKQNL